MSDLIKKIECLKLSDSFIIGEYSFGFTDGKNKAIKEVLELLNQYNIITAPKTIKLSEIVSKLNEIFGGSEFSSEIYFNRELNAIGEGEYDKNWFMDTWTPFIYLKENKISRIVKLGSESTKWLYELWIAGTTIIDDLEEQYEQH